VNSQPQQQQIPLTQPFAVTLEAQQWNNVLAALAETPFKIAAPLIQAISEQLQSAAGQAQPNGPMLSPETPAAAH
jgi:hypothetical protein